MIVVANRIRVPAGQGAQIEASFRNRAGAVDQQPGFISFELWKLGEAHGPGAASEAGEPHEEFLAVTRWRSQADFEAWTQSDAFRRAHERVRPAGGAATAPAGPPRLEIYQVILPES